jgi:acetyltransferase-like isoleucine patch superfamily enzyme/acyl carrier protein
MSVAYAAPQTPNETLLATIWSTVMHLEKLSVEDNVFHMGAHSLTCVRLAAEIYNRLAIRVPVSTIFQYPTIRELGKVIESLQGKGNAIDKPQDNLGKVPSELSSIHGNGSVQPVAVESLQDKRDAIDRPQDSLTDDHREIERPRERLFGGIKNRLLQLVARIAPIKLRAILHRWRGVHIGSNVYIGYDAIIETARPWLVSIGNDSGIGIRTTIIGHFAGMEAASVRQGSFSVSIGNKAWVGPGVVILPNVTIGDGAVVAAGSTVTTSIPAGTFALGNPAVPVAKCGIPLADDILYDEFLKYLEPL